MIFSKWHGNGNDFIIINGLTENIDKYNQFCLSQLAIKICDRNYGIGANGLILLLPSSISDFKVAIYNSDGSIAEMCGNGVRCVARYIYEEKLVNKTKLYIETLAGIIETKIILENGKFKTITVDMGEPRLYRSQIPMTGNQSDKAVAIQIDIEGKIYEITAVSMGNPHCVVFVDNIKKVKLKNIGPILETHILFPQKTNVEFVQVQNKKEITMRVWERGVGITKACGTGACACVVAGVLNNKNDREVVVHLDGGDLLIIWENNNHVYMSGPAVKVCCGNY